MAHLIDQAPPQMPPPGEGAGPPALRIAGFDAPRLAFWAALAIAAGAAGVALTAGPVIGGLGAALFFGMAGVSVVFLVWMSRGAGRTLGLFPARGAAEAAAAPGAREFTLLEAIDEPALITDRNGAAAAANAAYLRLAEAAGAMGESSRPPLPDRLFGADPAMSAPMYRLGRAAGLGQRRAETLPAVRIAVDRDPARFEAAVAPTPDGRVLWRLRPIGRAPQGQGEDHQRLFLDDAPVGFFAARPDGGLVYMNEALRAALGYGETTAPTRLKDIIKEDPARVLRRDRRGFGATRTAVTLLAGDGAEIAATALTAWPADEPDGPCRGFVFFGEQAQVWQAGENPAPTRTPVDAGAGFFEHAPFGAALVDGADPALAAILDSNAALMEMAQGSATPGTAFADLFEAGDGPEALAERLRKSAGGQAVELTLATEPQRAAHVHFVRTGDGRGLAYIANVTEQRELEQRLAQSEKMREIGLLAGGVAHDFNNLLTVMMMTADYLLLRHPLGDPDYKDLNLIKAHALRAKELTEMLRAYARQQTLKSEIFEVAGFVQQMHEFGRRLVGDTIKAEIVHGANLPYVRVDKTQLERVIVNLMSNARDAMTPKDWGLPKGGVLTLATSRASAAEVRGYSGGVPIEDGDYVQISVSDTGCGIKPEDAGKIFHPFHSTKEPNKGTGLGLATSYGIIKQSGGYIFFDSKLGKGTTFRIFLPAHDPTPAELEALKQRERQLLTGRPAVDVSGRGRVLFVEDDDDVRAVTARNLEALGFEIVCAEEGDEGLKILRERRGDFHVIVSDVSMPILSGPEMIKAAGPEVLGETPVLFMSGFAQEHIASMIADLPNCHHISKPVGAADLARRIKGLMVRVA